MNYYRPVLIFYDEINKNTETHAMSAIESKFYFDVPQSITRTGGNYKIYFVLKERVDKQEGAGGYVGVEDDPAYREIFISQACDASVDSKSGYTLLSSNFDFDTQIYDYEKGYIFSSNWLNPVEENNEYVTYIYLPGLKDGVEEDDVQFVTPNGVTITRHSIGGLVYPNLTPTDPTPDSGDDGNGSLETEDEDSVGSGYIPDTDPEKPFENPSLSNKYLIYAATLDSTVTPDVLENIQVVYPVTFDFQGDESKSIAQKPFIKVVHEPNTVSVTDNTNLGIKMDAYVTAIDVTGMRNVPKDTKKYVIFSKDGNTVVCRAYNDAYCWIPTIVTGQAGTWEVSFAARGTDNSEHTSYTYYTGILKLPVLDTALTRFDLNTSTSYRAITDVDGKTLYDEKSFALYAMTDASTDAKLSHTASVIDESITWVGELRASYPDAVALTTLVTSFDTVVSNQVAVNTKLANLESTDGLFRDSISLLTANDEAISSEIESIHEIIDGLEETQSLERLDAHDEILAGIAEDIDALQKKDASIESSINSNKKDITALESSIDEVDSKYDKEVKDIKGVLSDHKFDIEQLEGETTHLRGRVVTLEDNVSANIKNLIEETAQRAAADTELNTKINNEISRATESENIIASGLANTNEELAALTTEVRNNNTTITNRVAAEEAARASADRALDNRTSILESTTKVQSSEISGLISRVDGIDTDKTIIRNDYTKGRMKTVVAKIIVLEPKSIDDIAVMVEVPYSTEAEQNT